jgi:hypothetical protein
VTAGAQSSATSAAVDRWALGVFVGIVVLAVPLLLYLGRDQWFYLDDWWLLGDGPASHKGLFDAHNGHWITVSAIIYRLNYRLWGLRTYLPYQVPVVLLQFGSAVLLLDRDGNGAGLRLLRIRERQPLLRLPGDLDGIAVLRARAVPAH